MPQFDFPLSRLCYAPHPEDVEHIKKAGLAAWLDAQFTFKTDDDAALAERLRNFKLQIKYPAGDGKTNAKGQSNNWPAVDEMRSLRYADAPIETAWTLLDPDAPLVNNEEYVRPFREVTATTILRAVHSRHQLYEQMVAFWHDHFNVAATERNIGVALPSYDREAIRPQALGNFRELLEAVAASPAMLIYLSNWTSRAGAANENYGRELLELHTLGRDAYLNDRYDRWRDVPGAVEGKPTGYIDEDVYEAARAFTGWSIENGQGLSGASKLPRTGKFIYVDAWHDGYQKRVLATEFAPFGAPQADARKVLDLAAYHPATARFIAQKLCRRFVSDQPQQAFVDRIAKVWMEHAKQPDQIAIVLKTIVLSPEFAASKGQKPRSPLALVASFVRATRIDDFTPTAPLAHQLEVCGQHLFGWPAPNGRPDTLSYYMTPEFLRERWVLFAQLANNAWGTGRPKEVGRESGQTTPAGEFISHWLAHFSGSSQDAPQFLALSGLDAKQDITDEKRRAQLLGLCAAVPQFQIT